MRDILAALINEMVCTYRQVNGCNRGHCLNCDLVCEDAEIIAALEAGIEALEEKIPEEVKENG